MEKTHLDRRLDQMRARGDRLPRAASTSATSSPGSELRERYDAVVLAIGATAAA